MQSFKKHQKERLENVKISYETRLKERNPKKDGLVCTCPERLKERNPKKDGLDRMVERVDPLVNMGQITRVTVPVNLALVVVAEVDDLTLVLVRATKNNEYSDLFHAIPWSQGTLGLLVAAEIKLIHIRNT
ncbi:unnamed protein product [Fraxinus pennsylvanica]|uniref:Uncharacterized protein n=1 Tax=Fraxinus pennsylvanica TaxID=56036 RepID=A0AAD1ZSF2_9LAMI|nr:unnamed protein product [Fraxinus pennsylvanica]